MNRVTVVVLATLAVVVAALPAPASEAAVDVEVTTDRMVFLDGLYDAAFVSRGVCLSHGDFVRVSGGDCDGSSGTEGTVRRARLGFEVVRAVDVGPARLPVTEPRWAEVPEQLTTVLVDVTEPGDLTVTVAATPTDEVDPEVVAGSVSDGGTVDGRAVTWEHPDAEAGSYEFSVRLRPNAADGFSGGFVPEVAVERDATSAQLAAFATGAVPAPGGAVDRRSVLVMDQQVTPAQGPPRGVVEEFRTGAVAATPSVWQAGVALDGHGTYNATASGEVAVATSGLLDEIAPGARGVANTFSMSRAFFTQRGWQKADHATEWQRDEEGNVSGFGFRMATADPADGSLTPNGPLAGTFYDGDAVHVGLGAAGGRVSADREGPPPDDDGTVAVEWDGTTALAWSGLWANPVPGARGNHLNPDYHLHQAEWQARAAAGLGDARPFGVIYNMRVTLPVMAVGGSIDNRAGAGARAGQPTTIAPLPDGWRAQTLLAFNVWLPDTRYEWTMSLDPATQEVTFTPAVGAGGVWLESEQDGYDRDWSNLHLLTIVARDRDARADDLPLQYEETMVVPHGTAAAVEALDAATGAVDRVDLTPGEWQVAWSDTDGLEATRVHQPQLR